MRIIAYLVITVIATTPVICQERVEHPIWVNDVAPISTPNIAHLTRGIQHARQRNPEQAVFEFNQCTSFDPLSLYAVKTVAGAYNTAEDYKKAITIADYLLKRASKDKSIDPRFLGGVYALRANANDRLGETDKALSDFHTASTLKPANAGEYLCRASDILLSKHRPKDALKMLQEALTHNTKSPYVHKLLGACYLQLNQPEEAIKSLKTSIQILTELRKRTPDLNTGTYIECYKRLVLAYRAAGKTDLARSTQKEVDALTSGWNDTLFGSEPAIKK